MRRVIVFVLLFSGSRLLYAQDAGSYEIPEVLVEMIQNTLESSEISGSDAESGVEEILEYYRNLLRNPLDINHASRNELERLELLTSYQIELIIDYISEYGALLSLNELFNIPGMDRKVMELLLPFLTTVAGHRGFPEPASLIKDARGQLLLRGKTIIERQVGFTPVTKAEYEKKPDCRYLGLRGLLYSQLKYESTDKIKCAVTFEKDPGEKGVDYKSINLSMYNIGSLDRFVAGDFTARFGQGLVLWNSFSMNSYTDVRTIFKPEAGITPYNSTDENRSFRGAASTFSWNRMKFSLLASSRSYDARVVDGEYTSLLTTGLHNTKTTLERKGSINAILAGSNFSYTGKNFRISQTSAIYKYSLPYGGKDSIIQAKDAALNGYRGNVGIDGYWVFKRARLFGEAAIDHTGSFAALAGILYSPGNRFETGIILRDYAEGYRAPFAGSISKSSSIGNERGARVSSSIFIGKFWRVSASAELLEGYHNITFAAIRNKEEGSTSDFRFVKTEGKYAISYRFSYRISSRVCFMDRFDFNRMSGDKAGDGYHLCHETVYKALSKRVDASLRVAFFNATLWDNRIYVYERDMLYNYSVPFYYGKGIRWYFCFHASPFKRVDLWLKISQIRYLDRDIIGEGTELISGPNKSEAKLQVRIRL